MTLSEIIANFKKRLNRPEIQEFIAKAKARAEEERQAKLKAQEQIAKTFQVAKINAEITKVDETTTNE